MGKRKDRAYQSLIYPEVHHKLSLLASLQGSSLLILPLIGFSRNGCEVLCFLKKYLHRFMLLISFLVLGTLYGKPLLQIASSNAQQIGKKCSFGDFPSDFWCWAVLQSLDWTSLRGLRSRQFLEGRPIRRMFGLHTVSHPPLYRS